MSHHDEWEEYVTASEEIQNLRLENERLRPALAVALLGLDLIAQGVLRSEDARRTLDVIGERYGFTPENT